MERHNSDVKEQANIDRQERQLEATLALARQAAEPKPEEPEAALSCKACGVTIEGKLKDHTCEASRQ